MSHLSRLGRAMRRRNRPAVDPAKRREQRERAKRIESTGRKVGAVTGSYIADLAALKQHLLLCDACDYKWKWQAAKYGYELKRTWQKMFGGVKGNCDGCREPGRQRKLYAHGSIIGKF